MHVSLQPLIAVWNFLQELKALEEQKEQLEKELVKQLDEIKKNLVQQVEETEQENCKAQVTLNTRVEELKKLSEEEKKRIEQLVRLLFIIIIFFYMISQYLIYLNLT